MAEDDELEPPLEGLHHDVRPSPIRIEYWLSVLVRACTWDEPKT
jgi:hypothetical protein